MEASGWSDYCEEREKNSELEETEEEKAHVRQILKVCHKMESEQELEDTEMLIRLIKIRNHIWT